MKLINVEIVPHDCQRYDTAGDWEWESDGSLTINVSRLAERRHMFLLAVHEIIEAIICKMHGISSEEVTKWDLEHIDDPDPGSIIGCPYRLEHHTALLVEAIMAGELAVDWDDYEIALRGLNNPSPEERPELPNDF
jgi:hypothetical protein